MSKRSYGVRRDYTDEDVRKIKEHNKRVLDELFSDVDWRRKLGIKHYGEGNWQKAMFGEDHPDYKQWKKDILEGNRTASTKDREREIEQYTKAGTFIAEYPNVKAAIEENGWGKNRGIAILECCRRRHDTAYNFVWKFKDMDYD